MLLFDIGANRGEWTSDIKNVFNNSVTTKSISFLCGVILYFRTIFCNITTSENPSFLSFFMKILISLSFSIQLNKKSLETNFCKGCNKCSSGYSGCGVLLLQKNNKNYEQISITFR